MAHRIIVHTIAVTALAAAGCGFARAADDSPPQGLARWFDPATAPFIPIPDVDHEPNSGTTLGLIPTWLVTDEQSQIRKIIAASVDYNSYFGAGIGLSIYGYRSEDTQWTAIAGVNQHVERTVDYDYQTGRLRKTTWSFDARATDSRSSTICATTQRFRPAADNTKFSAALPRRTDCSTPPCTV